MVRPVCPHSYLLSGHSNQNVIHLIRLNIICPFFLSKTSLPFIHIILFTLNKNINKMKDHDLEKWFLFIAEYRSTKTEDVYIYKYWSILHVHESTCGTECYCTSMLEREGHTHLWCILHHLIQYKLLFWFINSYIQFLL